MIDGIFYNPTMILFGKGMEDKVGEEIAKYSKKILLVFGGASFKKYGLYQRVAAALSSAGVEFRELGGVLPNPRADLVYRGIELCRQEKIDFILGVGGGSVIDTAKAVSLGVPYAGDFFDFYKGKEVPRSALKVATVLTAPGTGSESSPSSVITFASEHVKSVCYHNLLIPVFSILNPELTYTLPPHQTACGIVDAIAHILERYFSNTTFVDCTDRICEGLIKTLMNVAVLVREQPNNYDVRAEIMWACKLAHDNTAGFGRKQDWSSHHISHVIGSLNDSAHGAILSVIFPAWMKHVSKINQGKFVQFAARLFDIDTAADEAYAVTLAIERFEEFLKSISMPLTLRELGMTSQMQFQFIAQRCTSIMPSGTIGNFVRLSQPDIVEILKNAY